MSNNSKYTKEQLKHVARNAAREFGVPEKLLLAQINQESGWNPNAKSKAGAIGIAQIMPATAKGWGVDPTDPVASINAMAKNMAAYAKTYNGDWGKALAAYNAGTGAVAKYGGIPPYQETQNYVKNILAQADISTPINVNNTITGAASPMSANQPIQTQNPNMVAQNLLQLGFTPEQIQQIQAAYLVNQRQTLENYLARRQADMNYRDIPVNSITPREIQQIQEAQIINQNEANKQAYLQQIDPNSAANLQAAKNIYDRLERANNDYNKALQERFVQGYTIDPQRLVNLQTLNNVSALNAKRYGTPVIDYRQQYLQRQQDLYEAQVAAANGIPYQDFIATKNAQAGMAQKMAELYGALGQEEFGYRSAANTAAGNMYGKDVDLVKTRLENLSDLQKAEMENRAKYAEQETKLYETILNNAGTSFGQLLNYYGGNTQKAMDAAASIVNNQLSNITDINVANIQGQTSRDVQSMQGQQKLEQIQAESMTPQAAADTAKTYAEAGAWAGMSPYGLDVIKASPYGQAILPALYDPNNPTGQKLNQTTGSPTSQENMFRLFNLGK